jgi:hypothetical protein
VTEKTTEIGRRAEKRIKSVASEMTSDGVVVEDAAIDLSGSVVVDPKLLILMNGSFAPPPGMICN